MAKKKIWILNHYATNFYFDKLGRHYSFSENLRKRGYETTIFCASTRHNSADIIEMRGGKYVKKIANNTPYVFVKTVNYYGNGLQRIINMLSFYRNLFPVTKKYIKTHGKPDVILASSVHPLTLVAGIQIAKKLNIPCICEVRDLWPECVVVFGSLKKNSIIAKVLYQGERWIYQKADRLIFTWEGGKDYIIEKGWEKQIDLSKVKHINNGVDIDQFDKNSEENQVFDPELDDKEYKNIVYAGSIRKINNLGMLLDTAKIIQNQGIKDIRFLIYGFGTECEILKKRCREENISNVFFKGRIEKKYIPSVLKRSYINIMHHSSASIDRYGQSQNKLFEYLAAGKFIIQTYTPGYSVVAKYNSGFDVSIQNAEEIAKIIIKACNDDECYQIFSENARKSAQDYDFKKLTQSLIETIEDIV